MQLSSTTTSCSEARPCPDQLQVCPIFWFSIVSYHLLVHEILTRKVQNLLRLSRRAEPLEIVSKYCIHIHTQTVSTIEKECLSGMPTWKLGNCVFTPDLSPSPTLRKSLNLEPRWLTFPRLLLLSTLPVTLSHVIHCFSSCALFDKRIRNRGPNQLKLGRVGSQNLNRHEQAHFLNISLMLPRLHRHWLGSLWKW